jgi:hypothetical protein
MENMISLNELEQSNSKYQSFVLSDNYTIYKTKFNSEFTKEDFIKRIKENKSLYYKNTIRDNHSVEISIECPEFTYIDKFFINAIKDISNPSLDRVSKFSWIYTQTKDFSVNWMDNHKDLHRFNKSHITTQWVCVLYLQIPDDMKNGEGDLVFKTENADLYRFTPKEYDLLIFSGLLDHMTIPNENSSLDRISYVSNFSFNLTNDIKY